MTLRNRLTGAFMLVAVVSAGAAGLLIDRTVRQSAFDQVAERLSYEVTMTGQIMASALFAPLAPGDSSLQGPVRDLGSAVHTHLSLLTPEGVVAADSDLGARGASEPPGGAEEVMAALRDGRGTSVRLLLAEPRLWVAEKVVRDGRVLGVARASVPMTVVEREVSAIRSNVLLACLGALLFAALVAFALSRTISGPVRKLALAAKRIGLGDLDTVIDVRSGDEVGELGTSFSEMSRSLKKLIEKLDTRNAEMRYVLDAVDQGLVLVDLKGEIVGERSARVDEWFAAPKRGTRLSDLFRGASTEVRESMQLGWEQVADDVLPIDVVLDQLPKRVVTGTRTFDLAYAPTTTGDGQGQILVVITDTTAAAEAERKETEQRDLLGIFGRCFRDHAAVVDFLHDADQLVASVLSTRDLAELKRDLHTLKGNCGVQGVAGIAAMCHEIESHIAEDGDLPALDADRLRARWRAFRANTELILVGRNGIVIDELEMEETVTAILSGDPRDAIAERIKAWAHAPAEAILTALGERAKQLAAQLGKGTVEVRIDHDDSRLERARWSPLWSGLAHAVRNALDHGLESPAERREAGKPAGGLLQLSVRNESGELRVEVKDDGRGISWERIAGKLAEQGRPNATREDLLEGLFSDGLSTAASVTEISGRGVGMGALREAVRSLGGTLEIESVQGKGTAVRCRFPFAKPAPSRPSETRPPPRLVSVWPPDARSSPPGPNPGA